MTPHPLPVLRLATHLARRSRRWSVREMRCIGRCLFTQRKRKQSLHKRHGGEALTGPDLYPSHVWCAAALCSIFKLCSVGVASPLSHHAAAARHCATSDVDSSEQSSTSSSSRRRMENGKTSRDHTGVPQPRHAVVCISLEETKLLKRQEIIHRTARSTFSWMQLTKHFQSSLLLLSIPFSVIRLDEVITGYNTQCLFNYILQLTLSVSGMSGNAALNILQSVLKTNQESSHLLLDWIISVYGFIACIQLWDNQGSSDTPVEETLSHTHTGQGVFL